MSELDKLEQASWTPTVDVYVQVSYTKILDIDTINQRFQAEAIIESKWCDPHIKSFTHQIDEKKMWRPDIYVENAIKDVREEVSYKVLPFNDKILRKTAMSNQNIEIKDKEQYMVCELRKVTGIFYENLELEDFPLDIQDLSLTVATKKPGSIVNFILLQNETKSIKISNTLDKSMWKMHNRLHTSKDKIHREYSFGKREYPAIIVSAKASRLPGFFYWNALIPILLVSLASLAPFVVDIKIPQSRLPATCTLMLTSVSIRWTVGRLLPTVSYLTSLDKYSLMSMLIITTELIYHGIMGYIFRKIPEDIAYKIDAGAFLVFCSLIILKQLVFFGWISNRMLHRKKINSEELKSNAEDDHLSLCSLNFDDLNIPLENRNSVTFNVLNAGGKKYSNEREAMLKNEDDGHAQLN